MEIGSVVSPVLRSSRHNLLRKYNKWQRNEKVKESIKIWLVNLDSI